jgi:hypothetical protein
MQIKIARDQKIVLMVNTHGKRSHFEWGELELYLLIKIGLGVQGEYAHNLSSNMLQLMLHDRVTDYLIGLLSDTIVKILVDRHLKTKS